MSNIAINKKIVCILIGSIAAFGIIFLRLIYLQVYCSEYFVSRSQRNFIRYTTIASARGSIRDIQGNLLATNRPITTLYWQGTGKSTLTQEQLLLLQAMESITGKVLTSGVCFDAIVLSEKKAKQHCWLMILILLF